MLIGATPSEARRAEGLLDVVRQGDDGDEDTEGAVGLLCLAVVRAVDVARAADARARHGAGVVILAALRQARAALRRHHRLRLELGVEGVERRAGLVAEALDIEAIKLYRQQKILLYQLFL